jgi:hypothetical protein
MAKAMTVPSNVGPIIAPTRGSNKEDKPRFTHLGLDRDEISWYH